MIQSKIKELAIIHTMIMYRIMNAFAHLSLRILYAAQLILAFPSHVKTVAPALSRHLESKQYAIAQPTFLVISVNTEIPHVRVTHV